jgi:hypothetical protein
MRLWADDTSSSQGAVAGDRFLSMRRSAQLPTARNPGQGARASSRGHAQAQRKTREANPGVPHPYWDTSGTGNGLHRDT